MQKTQKNNKANNGNAHSMSESSLESRPKISIITIVFNDVNNIYKTINSCLEQSYKNIEYILVDGKSSDGTKELILETITSIANIHKQGDLEARFYLEGEKKNNPNFSIKFLSQKDNGIYDAMNKGIDLAGGEWCNFMNCGDRFYSKDTILSLFSTYYLNHANMDAAVIYGNTQMIYDENNSKILQASHNHKFHHKFIHQSAFINTKIMKKYKYDTRFKIAGDTHFFTNLYNKKYPFCYINQIISSFNIDGVSSKVSYQMFKEDCIIGYKYNKLYPLFNALKLIFRDAPRYIIRSILPNSIKNKLRVRFSKNKV